MSKKILRLSRKLLRKDPVLVIGGHDFNRDPHRSGETHSRDVSTFQGYDFGKSRCSTLGPIFKIFHLD
ncbi:hypothetical protein CDAR_255471 [Caerostris darwini]|uniref:Uncharacterized protein n=1 Tax=Caerostris darwini TaxID=1538125 RepID=A0AAV4NPU6_9ARAC|nr:hypothetical protein CDAR_255471 [Caerostris darwini]